MGNNLSIDPSKKFHIVVVGASFGGRIISGAILNLDKANIEITMVDKAEHFEFICTNYKTLCDEDSFEYLSVMNKNSLKEFEGKVKFVQGMLTKVERRHIELDGGRKMDYDALVLCTGA